NDKRHYNSKFIASTIGTGVKFVYPEDLLYLVKILVQHKGKCCKHNEPSIYNHTKKEIINKLERNFQHHGQKQQAADKASYNNAVKRIGNFFFQTKTAR